jgi:hypothetical protein
MDGLEKSDWFIAVGTDVIRQNFSWCGVELGIFTESKRRADTLVLSPIVCIYDQSVPELFRTRKQTQMVALKPEHTPDLSEIVEVLQRSPIYELLTEFSEYYRNFYDIRPDRQMLAEHDEWAKKSSLTITDNYWQSIQTRIKNNWFPQKHVKIHIQDGNFFKDELKRIPKSAEVEISIPAYGIFGIAIPNPPTRNKIKWSEFEDKIRAQTGGLSVTEMMNDIIISVLPDNDEATNDDTFLAPNKTQYRIILAKHSIYGNGKREFTLQFLETIGRNYGGEERTTLLTAGIILASKYRFLFLEQGSRYTTEVLDTKRGKSLVLELKQMMKDIRRIHAEAADDGLADVGSIKRLLGDTEEIDHLFETWWEAVAALDKNVGDFFIAPSDDVWPKVRNVLEEFCKTTAPLNRRFLDLAMTQYMSVITENIQHGPSAPHEGVRGETAFQGRMPPKEAAESGLARDASPMTDGIDRDPGQIQKPVP